MGQVSAKLRRMADGYAWWCPACEEMHAVNGSWTFNGDVDRPSFRPSIRVTGKQCVVVNGEWTGEWKTGPDGKALDLCCHFFLTDGQLQFCGDCTHALKGQTVPLPDLPAFLKD